MTVMPASSNSCSVSNYSDKCFSWLGSPPPGKVMTASVNLSLITLPLDGMHPELLKEWNNKQIQ
jgi:hypothetical protein